MASTQDLGKVRMVAKGAYNSATNYEADDWVTYEGSSYYCKQNSTGHAPTDTTYWGLLASKGDAGASPDITMSATSDGTSSDNPTVSVTKGGTTSNPTYALAFSGLKGGKGDTGDTGDSLTASSVHANDKTTVTIKNARTEATVNTFDVPDGEDGKGINNITKTGTSGLVDTYTITYTDGTTSTFTVTNGQDGQGSGDMTKAVYDSDNDVADAGGIKAYVSSHGGAVQSVNNKTGAVVLTASDVGAGSATDVTNNANAISAIKDGTNIDSFADVETALGNKADKVSSPTSGDFASLDSNGNLTDSGKKASDFASSAIMDGQSIDSFGDVESALAGKFPRSEQAVLGAKNIWPLKLSVLKTYNITGTWSNNVYTIGNLTFTVTEDDGYVTDILVNGSHTSRVDFTLDAKPQLKNVFLPYKDKRLTLNGCPQGGSTNSYWLVLQGLETDEVGAIDAGNGTSFTVSDFSNFNVVNGRLAIAANTSVDNLHFKPMVRLATDTDATYAPYAKTNRELTEDVANIPTVTANPAGTATGTLTKLRINNTIYGIDSGGSITPKVLASVTGDGVKTANQLLDELYLQLLPIEFDKLIGTVLVTGMTCYFLSHISVNDQDVEYSTEYTLESQWGTHDIFLQSSGSSVRIIDINNRVINYGDGGSNIVPNGRVFQIVKPSAYVTSSGIKNLLWTNSSPTSEFAAGAVSAVKNTDGYDLFLIDFITNKDYPSAINTVMLQPDIERHNPYVLGDHNNSYWYYCYTGGTGSTSYEFFGRGAWFDATSKELTFARCVDTSDNTHNGKMIPYKVYGIKL